MPPVKPKVISFLIADVVIQDKATNKWSAIGIFDRIMALGFPCVHPSLSLYIRLSDAEGQYAIRVEFRDVNDSRLAVFEGLTLSIPSRLSHPDLGIKTINLPIPKPGRYYFDLYFNGELTESLPLEVEEMTQTHKKDGS